MLQEITPHYRFVDAGPQTVDVKGSQLRALVGLKGFVTKEKELLRIDREVKRIDKDLANITLDSPADLEAFGKSL